MDIKNIRKIIGVEPLEGHPGFFTKLLIDDEIIDGKLFNSNQKVGEELSNELGKLGWEVRDNKNVKYNKPLIIFENTNSNY